MRTEKMGLTGKLSALDAITAELIKTRTDVERLREALKDVIGMLDDPHGAEHVRDMRGAVVIARAALKGDARGG